jgi:hypothetical protein
MKAKLRITSFHLIVVFGCALVFALAVPSTATAQGCALCRDTTAGSTPQARKALRLAIPLLGIPAIGIFAGALLLARKVKPGQ